MTNAAILRRQTKAIITKTKKPKPTPHVRELRTLERKIRSALTREQRGRQNSLSAAISAGEGFLKSKELVAYGEWEKWVEENFKITPRMARYYMRLARMTEEERKRVSEVTSLREAVRELSLLDAVLEIDEEEEADHKERAAGRLDKTLDGRRHAAESSSSAQKVKIDGQTENVPAITTTARPSTTAEAKPEAPKPVQQNLIPEERDLRSPEYKRRAATALNKLYDFSRYSSEKGAESVALAASKDERNKLMGFALVINAWIGQLIEYLKERDAKDQQP